MARMPLLPLIGLVSLFFGAGLAIEFINPPPPGADLNDFSLNTVYQRGSTITIQWDTPVPNFTAMTLFQLNGTQFLYPFEYIEESLEPNITSVSWKVQTTKDLSLSPMFYMSFFIKGSSSGSANSHYFNISSPGGSPKLAATSLVDVSSSSGSSTATGTSSPTPVSIPATTAQSSPSLAAATVSSSATAIPPPPSEPQILDTGAKVGIAVGVSVAGIFGIFVGWFIFGRRKNGRDIGGNPPSNYKQSDRSEVREGGRESFCKVNHELETTQPTLLHEMPVTRG